MEPIIEVGILFAPIIRFCLNGSYSDGTNQYTGNYTLCKIENRYVLASASGEKDIILPLTLEPENYTQETFELSDVTIGINFHWERKENQSFQGMLKIIDETEHLTAINILLLEDYLLSVISSEMSANSSPELLKAHAVISRSWLLAQKEKAQHLTSDYNSCRSNEHEYIRWYDREDHAHFDVCADDHCQRYQGVNRACTPTVKDALNTTHGEVLTYNNQICDARFSKCCGGVAERFDNTWEPVEHPYLVKVIDSKHPLPDIDLTEETQARQWILSSPEVFCNTTDASILHNVLNDYDRETQHFFRWTISYTTEELTALVKSRIGIDFGRITHIEPLERGVSGRIIRLRIVGTLRTMTIGKELVIRKAFSDSHLYSSAFIIEETEHGFTFRGAGWGHGVGLCQIGAAVMGAQGYSYTQILAHYFKNATLERIY